MIFERLNSGNVVVKVDGLIIRSFPPSAYIIASSDNDQVIRIDADPAGGNNSKTFEFSYQLVTSPFSATRSEMIQTLSSEYFKTEPTGDVDVNQIFKSALNLLQRIQDELELNNKLLKKIVSNG